MPPRLTLQGSERKRFAPQTHHSQGPFFVSATLVATNLLMACSIPPTPHSPWGLAGGTHRLLTCPRRDIGSHQNPDPGEPGGGVGVG